MGSLFEINTADIEGQISTTVDRKDEAKALIENTRGNIRQYLSQVNHFADSEYSKLMLYKWFIL